MIVISAIFLLALLSSPVVFSREQRYTLTDYSENDLQTCRNSLHSYIAKISTHLNCSLVHLLPSSMCTKCRETFLEASNSYGVLNHVDSGIGSLACKELFISKNHLYVDSFMLSSSYSNFISENSNFEYGRCVKCYKNHNITQGEFIDGLTDFLDYYEKLVECYRNHQKDDAEKNPQHGLCKSCKILFDSLMRTYYERIADNNTDTSVVARHCLDISDRILEANKVWDEFNCVAYATPSTGFYVLVFSTMMLLPLFYVYNIYKYFTDPTGI